ncbi:MAG: hypothetical protein ACREBW_08810, partial [Candidatus Micrarchaeaceae archaeon]
DIARSELACEQLSSVDAAKSLHDFGSKTGWLDDADHVIKLAECGFLADPAGKEFVFSIFLSGTLDAALSYSQDSANRLLLARLFRAIYDEFD